MLGKEYEACQGDESNEEDSEDDESPNESIQNNHRSNDKVNMNKDKVIEKQTNNNT